eukprot:3534796-Pleurochrysis_carterae.AAC.1
MDPIAFLTSVLVRDSFASAVRPFQSFWAQALRWTYGIEWWCRCAVSPHDDTSYQRPPCIAREAVHSLLAVRMRTPCSGPTSSA